MSKTLPPEMIADVLFRLPVKSLLRFRSTSKPFCSMIDGPDFTKRHLSFAAQTHSKQSLVLTSHKLYSIDLPALERAVEIDHPLKALQGATEVIGSCNGLLCLCNPGAETVLLWNMSTRKHHLLPYKPIDSPSLHYVAHGFGYDPVHDDYKVMRVVRFGHLGSKVLIFSLKSNSWKSVGAFPYELPPFQSRGVFGDGALHWLVGDMSSVAFDLATEVYRAVPQPPVVGGGFFVQMTTWEGRLCAVCNYVGKPTQMWVLKGNEGVGESSWEKLQSVASPRNIVPVACVSSGNELVLLQENARFLSYDLKANKAKDVVIQGLPPSFEAVLYIESLVKPSPTVSGDDAAVGKHKGPRGKKNGTKRDDFLSKGFKLVL